MHSIDDKAIWPGWETVRLLGRGSFGAVYEIERDVLGEKEKAALKVITIPQSSSDVDELYSDGYDDESITETFKSYLKSIVAEYSLMRKLNSSANVVKCDDVRYVPHDDGFGWDIFIKMELLTPLTAAFPAVPDDAQVLKLGADLCQALVQCKKLDIVHRDIKPQNIFVSPLGDYKLGDFGIAKTVEKTSGGTKIGTYKYMAPEVYNNQPYGSGADIYSLGLVLYWLLNERRMPFLPLPPEKLRVGQEEAARLRRFHGEALPAPAHGSAALKQIVLKACAFDPKDRYQSAEELLRALQALDGRAAPALDPEPETVPEPSAAPAVDEDDERTVSVFGQGASDKQSEEKNQSEPATLSENAAEDAEEKTVSVFSRPNGEAKETKPPAVSDATPPEEEEQTVAAFTHRAQEPELRAAEGKSAEPEPAEAESTEAPNNEPEAPAYAQGAGKKKGKAWIWITAACACLLLVVVIGVIRGTEQMDFGLNMSREIFEKRLSDLVETAGSWTMETAPQTLDDFPLFPSELSKIYEIAKNAQGELTISDDVIIWENDLPQRLDLSRRGMEYNVEFLFYDPQGNFCSVDFEMTDDQTYRAQLPETVVEDNDRIEYMAIWASNEETKVRYNVDHLELIFFVPSHDAHLNPWRPKVLVDLDIYFEDYSISWEIDEEIVSIAIYTPLHEDGTGWQAICIMGYDTESGELVYIHTDDSKA